MKELHHGKSRVIKALKAGQMKHFSTHQVRLDLSVGVDWMQGRRENKLLIEQMQQ